MVTRCFCDPLIGIKTIKVAVCSPFEAAQIRESSETPSERIIKGLEKKGQGLIELDPNLDPDHATYLMWLGNNESPTQYIVRMATLADELGEELRQILLRHDGAWPSEIEAYYKGQLFERAFKCLGFPTVTFNKTEGKFTSPMTGDKVVIKITSSDMIRKETHSARSCAGKCGKNQNGELSVWVDKEKWEDSRVFILFHEIIHVKQRLLRKFGMEVQDLEEDTLYQVSPKLDALVFGQLFEGVLKSLL